MCAQGAQQKGDVSEGGAEEKQCGVAVAIRRYSGSFTDQKIFGSIPGSSTLHAQAFLGKMELNGTEWVNVAC